MLASCFQFSRTWRGSALCLALCVPSAAQAEESASLEPACFEVVKGRIPSDYVVTFAVDDDSVEEKDIGDAPSHRFYLNRKGGTFLAGSDDSRQNRSSLLIETSTIPAWQVSDEAWSEVVTCVQGMFERYDVLVSDEDPGGLSHVEAVVGGSSQDLKRRDQRSVGGIAPFPGDCGVIDNSIVFIFAEDGLGDNQRVCEVIAHEIAHSFGLDHSYYCEDVMTYLEGCGDKTFVDNDLRCGEQSGRECKDLFNDPPAYDCNRGYQNPVRILSERIGLKPVPPATGGCRTAGNSRSGGLPPLIYLLAFSGLLWQQRRHGRPHR